MASRLPRVCWPSARRFPCLLLGCDLGGVGVGAGRAADDLHRARREEVRAADLAALGLDRGLGLVGRAGEGIALEA
jgi:hypothetical protein